ncbi:MAG: hypothetical protein WBZ37_02295 [Mycobacterium sp.]
MVLARLDRVLVGDAGDDSQVLAAMMSGAIVVGVVVHPLIGEIEDDTPRCRLRRINRRLIHTAEVGAVAD